MKRKQFLALAAGAASLPLIAACGGSTGGGSSTAAAVEGEIEPRTISWLLSRPANGAVIEIMTALAEEYAADHEGFSLELITTPDRPSYIQKYETLAAANELPELFDTDATPFAAKLNAAERMVDVEDLLTQLGVLEDFRPAALDYQRFDDGTLRMIPLEFGVEVFWYNKALFAAAGVEVPTTLDEMVPLCEALAASGVTPIAVGGADAWPLERYVAYQQQVDTLRDKLVSAAIYPALLVGVGGLVVMFLLGYVVPRFSHIYEDVGSDLPWLSQVLLDWGRLVEAHALAMGGVLLAVIAALVLAARSEAVWAAVGRQAWRTPGIGERLRAFELARFYRTLGMLLSGGIPAVAALRMVSGLLSPTLRSSLQLAIERVREGQPFTATLAACGLATPVAQRMLAVGERAGNLGEMLTRSAEFHEEDTAREIEWLTRLFGPVLMLVIGGAIGLIVVLMYLPIFQLAESIG